MAESYMSGGADEAAKIKEDKKKLKADQKAQKKEKPLNGAQLRKHIWYNLLQQGI